MQVSGQSSDERRASIGFRDALASTALPGAELVDNLPLYMRHKEIAHVLALKQLYGLIVDIPGTIMEFGVRWGRNTALFASFRSILEPAHAFRRIVGFDTFAGFPDTAPDDAGSAGLASAGDLGVTEGYELELRSLLRLHESIGPLGHMTRTEIIKGDVRDTVPQYLETHPETIIALAYFDLDLHDPTTDLLSVIQPYLTRGSVLAFDELAHPRWPGETTAIRKIIGLDKLELRQLPNVPQPCYAVWDGS